MSAITRIETKLSNKRINLPMNKEIKEGYTEALRLLKDNITDENEITCESVRARCIAALAIDFQKGLCSEDILCNIPLNRR